jgi:hypothetical protein
MSDASWVTRAEAKVQHGLDPEGVDARLIRSKLVPHAGPHWLRLYFTDDIAAQAAKREEGR